MYEEKTSIEKLANMNLEGLLLPDPAPASYEWLWVLIGLLSLIAAILWKKRYDSPKATALRTLKKLHTQLKKDVSIDHHKSQTIKQQIARALCQGFSETRLDKVMPDNMKWREYLNTLETALYANKPANQPTHISRQPHTLLSLIKGAETWLKVSK